ncbi:MAG: hypothetical protein ACOYUZ_00930 [Patescibacteria group bacterium]
MRNEPRMRANYGSPQKSPDKPVKFEEVNTATRKIPRDVSAPKYKALQEPKEGLIRAVASRQAKQHYSWHGFERTWKAISGYCGLAVGFFDRELHVEQYIFLKIQAAANERLETLKSLRRRYASLSEQYSWLMHNTQHANAELKRIKSERAAAERELDRRDIHGDGKPALGWKRWLELEAEEVLERIRIHLLDMARNGRIQRKANHDGYLVVMANVIGQPTKKFWLIINPDSKRKFVVSFKTHREYKKSLRKHRRDAQAYVNEPQKAQRKQRKRGQRGRRGGIPQIIVSPTVH